MKEEPTSPRPLEPLSEAMSAPLSGAVDDPTREMEEDDGQDVDWPEQSGPVAAGAAMMPPPPGALRMILHLPHGRRAVWNEFVRLRAVIEPEPNPWEVQEDDVQLSILQFAERDGVITHEALRSTHVKPEKQAKAYSVPCTAELALLLLENESIKCYSSSPDRSFSYRLVFHLLTPEGRLYSDQEQSALAARPAATRQSWAAYQERRDRERRERRAQDERTFCVYTSLPGTLGDKSEATCQVARERIALRIQAHFRGATVRRCIAKSAGGRAKASEQYFVTPTAAVTPQQYINIERAPVTASDQLPLVDLRCIEVGETQPALVSLGPALRRTLGVKGCCMRRACVPNDRNECDGVDRFFDARRAQRRTAQGPSEGQVEWRAAQEAREAKRRRMLGRQQAEEEHVRRQSQDQEERCRAWELGRCAKTNHPHLHGSAEETMIITCCSARVPGDEGYSLDFRRCPFVRMPQVRCPYMGHEDE